jgi:hypothetical protein
MKSEAIVGRQEKHEKWNFAGDAGICGYISNPTREKLAVQFIEL